MNWNAYSKKDYAQLLKSLAKILFMESPGIVVLPGLWAIRLLSS